MELLIDSMLAWACAPPSRPTRSPSPPRLSADVRHTDKTHFLILFSPAAADAACALDPFTCGILHDLAQA
jgi:hypothetical protein